MGFDFDMGTTTGVSIDPDKMSAYIVLPLPDDGKVYTYDDVDEIIRQGGVKAGVLKEVVKDIVDNHKYMQQITIAEGKPAVNGVDGYFDYYFSNAEQDTNPIISSNGTVDYINTEQYTMVKKDDLVALYVPGTNGEFGYTVESTILRPKKGREKPPLRGKGFHIEDKVRYISDMDGRIDVGDSTINITNVLTIKESIDITRGHIDFDGDVIVRGDVHSGLKVKATGNITINGHVGASLIIAGKDIIIKQGVQGREKGKIEAQGNVTGKFFESAHVKAGQDVYANIIMNSYVEAKGVVRVDSSNGLVLGGSVCGIKGIKITNVGNEAEKISTLVVGPTLEMAQRKLELLKLIEKVEGEIDLLDRSAKMYEQMDKTKITTETEARRMKIIRAKVIKVTELKGYYEENNVLISNMNEAAHAKIYVKGLAYRGSRLIISGVRYNIREVVKDATFRLRGQEVIMEGN